MKGIISNGFKSKEFRREVVVDSDTIISCAVDLDLITWDNDEKVFVLNKMPEYGKHLGTERDFWFALNLMIDTINLTIGVGLETDSSGPLFELIHFEDDDGTTE